jgi:hypothetical protein
MDVCAHDGVLSEADNNSETREWEGEDPADWRPLPQRSLSRWYGKRLLTFTASDEISEKPLPGAFESLRSAWHREYGASSSFTKITSSPSYREIVRMGKDALPFIFEDLRQRPEPDHWFEALVEITHENPVAPEDKGYSRRMTKAWLKWARTNGYG